MRLIDTEALRSGRAPQHRLEVMQKAIELKKDQPYRSPWPSIVPGGDVSATRARVQPSTGTESRWCHALKLGVLEKVRKRWSREHTHDLWVGDFEEGPYVLEKDDVVPTHLSAFIDCHSRYIVEARYYFRQNLDILIDSLIRAFSTHGAPLELYLDNAKVYHANGLKAACYRLNINLLHRPPHDPPPGV